MAKAIPTRIGYLVNMLTQLKDMVMMAFTHLGLFKSPEVALYSGERITTTSSSSNENNNFVLMWDVSSPSLVPVPVPIVTAFIKKSLPVVLFSNVLVDDEDGEEGKLSCSVCWDCIERSQQIRELSNCSHVFHRECLDKWVDEGQVTCPLCRSMLLPWSTNPRLLLKNAHLSSSTTEQEQERDQVLSTPST